ncbi:hypothetical protein CR513_22816, partial [Mucuna pruriens]
MVCICDSVAGMWCVCVTLLLERGLRLLLRMSQAKKKEVDITWQHCESVPPNRLQVKCKYCSHACWDGIARMKHHLAGTKINVSTCTSVLDDVKEIQKKEENSLDCLEEVAKGKEWASKVVKQKTMNEICKDRDVAIQEICNCIYGNALPFNLVRSPLFVQMLKVVGEY